MPSTINELTGKHGGPRPPDRHRCFGVPLSRSRRCEQGVLSHSNRDWLVDMTRGDWYVSASGAYSRIHRHILEVEGIVYTAPCLPLLRSAGRLVAFAQVDDAQNNEEKHHDGIQAQHAK